jgi:branched-chain amino acid transport system ATP-binding protein
MMLEVRGLDVLLGDYQVLWEARCAVAAGEVVALLGPNGAGLLRPRAGEILLDGRAVTALPAHERVRHGIGHVLERRRLFPYLTVRQNVWLGAYGRAARPEREAQYQRMIELFPIIGTRARQPAHTLSGGEQQMVALARGLMARPRILLIDEPFLGLAPRIVEQLVAVIRRINRDGTTVLFIEQNVELALSLAGRGYILESGRTILDGPAADLLHSAEVRRIFLGG